MKFKLFAFGSLLVLLFSCTIENGQDEFIRDLAGKWKLYRIGYQGNTQTTSCDTTTVSEFKFDKGKDEGDYVGTVYFWSDTLATCSPDTFRGRWEWDDLSQFKLTITGVNSNKKYSNDFGLGFMYSDDKDDVADGINLTFKNEDEEFERVYQYRRIE